MKAHSTTAIACLLILLTSLCTNAQTITWQRTYGGNVMDYGYSMVQTPDDGFIEVGEKNIRTFIMRITKFGDTLWTRTLLGNGSTGVVILSDHNYLITGLLPQDPIVKIGLNGNVFWTHYGESGYLKASRDSGFLIARDLKIKKYNNEGLLVWYFDYSPYLSSMVVSDYETMPDNGVLIIGERTDSVMNMNKFFLRISKEGSFISFGKFSSATRFSKVSITKDNLIGIVGYRGSLISLAK